MNEQTQFQRQAGGASVLTPVRRGLLQRQCGCGTHAPGGGECDSCQKKREGTTLQPSAMSSGPIDAVPAIVQDVLQSPGQPLDATTRAFMEPRFGHDFSHVRVHTDTRATVSADEINARAY